MKTFTALELTAATLLATVEMVTAHDLGDEFIGEHAQRTARILAFKRDTEAYKAALAVAQDEVDGYNQTERGTEVGIA